MVTKPFGTTQNAQYRFGKVLVHDLDAMAEFYEAVFGLIPRNRYQDVMLGRQIDEITYQATHEGGPSLTLITYLDSTGPSRNESIHGFATTDIEGVIERARAAGGTVPEPIFRVEAFKLRCVFVFDPEGHLNEVIQYDA